MLVKVGDPIPLEIICDDYNDQYLVSVNLIKPGFIQFDPLIFSPMEKHELLPGCYVLRTILMPDEPIVLAYYLVQKVTPEGHVVVGSTIESIDRAPDIGPSGPVNIFAEEITAYVDESYLIATVEE